jgi:DNA-binding MarR family transcriptional regulator
MPMPPAPFSDLDPLLHQQLRLAVMSLLLTVESAEFTFLKEQTGATAGNLSVQLSKLEAAGYVGITKGFKGKVPQTLCRITPAGTTAFEQYVAALQRYLKPNGQ